MAHATTLDEVLALRSENAALRTALRHTSNSAVAFLRHFNPCDMAEDKSQQWQALYDQATTFNARLLTAGKHKNGE